MSPIRVVAFNFTSPVLAFTMTETVIRNTDVSLLAREVGTLKILIRNFTILFNLLFECRIYCMLGIPLKFTLYKFEILPPYLLFS